MARSARADAEPALPAEPDRARRRWPGRRPEPDLSLAGWHDAEHLFTTLRSALVPVEQPLVLVSQTQRSGGTLLNTLLDGHPQLHVHPWELHTGHPTKHDWPALDLAAGPDEWLDLLREPILGRLFADGYRKHPLVKGDLLPFTVVPSFVDRLFRVLCADRPPVSQRQVLDRYFTAFFNAWVDCQGLRNTPKLWVAGFGPRLAWGESRQRFHADYPDGRIVSSHRDPRAWWASASAFSGRYGEFDEAMALWRQGATEAIAAKRESPARVFLLTYETLVTEPERTTRALADWLELDWDPLLLQPTFNRQPVPANSSHGIPAPGIRSDSIARWRDVLSAETVEAIESQALELDSAVRAIADVA